jgi:cysteinyl-tRNA synthetase
MRMLVLNGNYRSPLSFTDESVSAAEQGLNRLRTSLKPANAGAQGASEDILSSLGKQVESTQKAFTEAMDDDFNTAGALGSIFDLVRQVNTARDGGATPDQLAPALKTLRDLAAVLGLRIDSSRSGSGDAEKFVDLLVELRNELRNQKLWALSDLVRDRLKALGVSIEDAKTGPTWMWD